MDTYNRTQSVSDNGLHIFDGLAKKEERNEMKRDLGENRKNVRKNGSKRACRIHIATEVEINNKCDLLMKKEQRQQQEARRCDSI